MATPKKNIRLALADDHKLFLAGLCLIFTDIDGIEVVLQATNGRELLDALPGKEVDVILLDLEMPKLDGVETLRRLKVNDKDVWVIVFTAFDTDERILTAVQAGAQGYLLKGVPRQELFKAI